MENAQVGVDRIETQTEAITARLAELIIRFRKDISLLDESLDRSVGNSPEGCTEDKKPPAIGIIGSIFWQIDELEEIEATLRGRVNRVSEII